MNNIYIEAKVSIKWNLQDLIKIATRNQNDNFDESNESKIKNLNQLKKLFDEDYMTHPQAPWWTHCKSKGGDNRRRMSWGAFLGS